MLYDNLPQALDQLVEYDRSITFIERDRSKQPEVIHFADLKDRAIGLLYHFQARGIQAGDELLIVINNNQAFLDAYWACLYGGIIPVPIAPGISDEQRHKLFRVFDTLKNPHVFIQNSLLGKTSEYAKKKNLGSIFRRIRQKAILAEGITDLSKPGQTKQVQAQDVAFIQFSSGSTSDPKGVVLTHQNLISNIRDMIETANLSDEDIGLSWMPLTHDMGLIGFHLMLLLAGMSHTIMATDVFIRRPLSWIQLASDHRANVLCSPNFGYRYLLKSFAPDKVKDIDLSHVRIIFNGAEPISARICDEFLNALAPSGLQQTAMYTVYGLAEASLAVSFPEVETEYTSIKVDRMKLGLGDTVEFNPVKNELALVNVGQAIGECKVRIGNDLGDDLGEDTVGRVLISGPNVTQGYYIDDRQLRRDVFLQADWLDTGDIGFMHHGNLYITGRLKDVIFVNGQNYYAHDIESVICEAELCELGKVLVTSCQSSTEDLEQMIVFVLHRDTPEKVEPLARKIANTVNTCTGAEVSFVVPVTHIPKTSSGKLQRFNLQNAFANGEFKQVAISVKTLETYTATNSIHSETEKFLQEKCKQVLEIDIGVQDNLFDIGVSSLKMIEIHEQIEQAFPGKIEVIDLFDHPTISDLAQFLDRNQAV